MKTFLMVSVLSLPMLTGSLLAFAQEDGQYTEYVGAAGSINWSTGRVSAEGYGLAPEGKNKKVAPLLACRAAVADAQRNLLESTQGVRVNSSTTVSNFVAANDEIKTSVEGVVKGAFVKLREPDAEGSCKVVMEISLQSEMTSKILQQEDVLSQQVNWRIFRKMPQLLSYLSEIPFYPQAYASELAQQASARQDPIMEMLKSMESRLSALEKNVSASATNSSSQIASAAPAQVVLPTGLIIDARGSNFIPSLSPKVRKLKGAVIYPAAESKERLINSGRLVSLFTRKLDFALKHPSVGDRPLLVKALRTWGDTRSEIVLNTDNANKLARLSDTEFFAEAGVIIVLD